MAAKGLTGWLLFAVPLAVPGVLFYQWHGRVDQANRRQDSTRMRIAGNPFPSSNEKPHLTRPIVAQPEPPMPAPAHIETPPLQSFQTPQPAVPGVLASALAAIPAPPQPPAPPVYSFVDWRDPTLSPNDIRHLEELRIAKEIAQHPVQLEAPRGKPPRPKPSAEKTVDLQGIIYIDASNRSAIVNGETVNEGQVIKTSAGKIKVLTITSRLVQFSHGGSRFNKSVDR